MRQPNALPDWPDKFLAAYRKNGNVSQSAKLARADRRTVQRARAADPAFAALMDEAQDEAVDALEQEARRRAVGGTLKPVFYQGQEVGQVREFSDTLLIVLLKANRPEKYKERADVTSSGDVRVTVTYEDAPGLSDEG